MTETELAKELRERLLARSKEIANVVDMVEEKFLNAVWETSDCDMILSYITCSCCGERQVDDLELEAAIAEANSADEFLDICSELAKGHLH